jgi:hypothetical protein
MSETVLEPMALDGGAKAKGMKLKKMFGRKPADLY